MLILEAMSLMVTGVVMREMGFGANDALCCGVLVAVRMVRAIRLSFNERCCRHRRCRCDSK